MACIVPINDGIKPAINLLCNYMYGHHDIIHIIKKEGIDDDKIFSSIEKELKHYREIVCNDINVPILHDATLEASLLLGVSKKLLYDRYITKFVFIENYFKFENGLKPPFSSDAVKESLMHNIWCDFLNNGGLSGFQRIHKKGDISFVNMNPDEFFGLGKSLINNGNSSHLAYMLLCAHYVNS